MSVKFFLVSCQLIWDSFICTSAKVSAPLTELISPRRSDSNLGSVNLRKSITVSWKYLLEETSRAGHGSTVLCFQGSRMYFSFLLLINC